jgi:protease-4
VSLETETVLDRRRLRRQITFWRAAGVLGVLAAIAGFAASRTETVGLERRQIARVAIEGVITDDRDLQAALAGFVEAQFGPRR